MIVSSSIMEVQKYSLYFNNFVSKLFFIYLPYSYYLLIDFYLSIHYIVFNEEEDFLLFLTKQNFLFFFFFQFNVHSFIIMCLNNFSFLFLDSFHFVFWRKEYPYCKFKNSSFSSENRVSSSFLFAWTICS